MEPTWSIRCKVNTNKPLTKLPYTIEQGAKLATFLKENELELDKKLENTLIMYNLNKKLQYNKATLIEVKKWADEEQLLAKEDEKKHLTNLLENITGILTAQDEVNNDYGMGKVDKVEATKITIDTLFEDLESNKTAFEEHIKKKGADEEEEKKKVEKVLRKLWNTYITFNTDAVKNVINKIVPKNKTGQSAEIKKDKLDKLIEQVDNEKETSKEMLEKQVEGNDVKKTEYKDYIKNLKKLMIKDKADKLDKLKDIGKKIIELDNAKQTLKKLEVMLDESEQAEEQSKQQKTEDNTANAAANEDVKNKEIAKVKVPGDNEQKSETPSQVRARKMREEATGSSTIGSLPKKAEPGKGKVEVNKDNVKKAMNKVKKGEKIDLAKEHSFLQNDLEVEVDAIKANFDKTPEKALDDYYNLFSTITKGGTIPVTKETKYEDKLLEKIAFGKNLVILEGEKNASNSGVDDIFVIRTDDDNNKVIEQVIVYETKKNNIKWFDIPENVQKGLRITEGGKINDKILEDFLNKQNIKEVKINLEEFKTQFPKYIGDATVTLGGGGKRKSKSRKSKKRRKGRKNKTKKRSKSKK